MSWEACIAEIRAAANGPGGDAKLSDRDIERMLEAIIRRAQRRCGTGVPDAGSLRAAASEIADETRLAAAIEKRNALLNMQARIGYRDDRFHAPRMFLFNRRGP
jgi:hypothetical protein